MCPYPLGPGVAPASERSWRTVIGGRPFHQLSVRSDGVGVLGLLRSGTAMVLRSVLGNGFFVVPTDGANLGI